MTYSILVEHVQGHFGESFIAPVPVDQQQTFEEPEPRQCKIRRHDRLEDTKIHLFRSLR